MYASKSFINVAAFLSNVPGTNSPIGEITPQALTFSREIGVYEDPTQPGFTLYNLKSSNDGADGSTAGSTAMPAGLVNQTISLMSFIATKISSTNGQIYADQLLQDLSAFGAANNMDNISIGDVVQHDTRWAPDWVKFQSALITNGSPATETPNENTVWLSVAALDSEYDEFEIVVVPPVDSLDLFFGTGTSVVNMVGAITPSQIIDRMQAASNNAPWTIGRTDPYTYTDPLNSTRSVPVYWSVIIYGPAGNNVDSIKDALVAFILAHSSHGKDDWTKIFPDIFKRTEFILAPHWNLYAIPNRTQAAGIYTPVVNYNAGKAYLKQITPAYDPAFVEAHANVLGHPYRSLLISLVGGPDNRNSLFEIGQVFADYINVSSTSLDFNRMSPDTQGWALMIANMLIIAETMAEHTTLPQGLTKVTRNNLLYLVQTYDNIQYLVVAKRSVYALLGLTY